MNTTAITAASPWESARRIHAARVAKQRKLEQWDIMMSTFHGPDWYYYQPAN